MKAMRVPGGEKISNSRIKPKGDISGGLLLHDCMGTVMHPALRKQCAPKRILQSEMHMVHSSPEQQQTASFLCISSLVIRFSAGRFLVRA